MGSPEYDELIHDHHSSIIMEEQEAKQNKRDQIAINIMQDWRAHPEEALESMTPTEREDLLYDLFYAWGRGITSWDMAYKMVMDQEMEQLAKQIAERET